MGHRAGVLTQGRQQSADLRLGQPDHGVLANGRHDEYLDGDTVPLPEALRIVGHILTAGTPPSATTWLVDR